MSDLSDAQEYPARILCRWNSLSNNRPRVKFVCCNNEYFSTGMAYRAYNGKYVRLCLDGYSPEAGDLVFIKIEWRPEGAYLIQSIRRANPGEITEDELASLECYYREFYERKDKHPKKQEDDPTFTRYMTPERAEQYRGGGKVKVVK